MLPRDALLVGSSGDYRNRPVRTSFQEINSVLGDPEDSLKRWLKAVGEFESGQTTLEEKCDAILSKQSVLELKKPLTQDTQAEFEKNARELDVHLSALGYICSRSNDPDIYSRHIPLSVPKQWIDIYHQTIDYLIQHKNQPNAVSQIGKNELMVTEILLRNLVNFGLWKSIHLSEISSVALEKGSHAYVGAVALDKDGTVLQAAWKGESKNLSEHAEDILLQKIRDTSQVFVVATNLEPCRKRSQTHIERLKHGLSCSELLVKADIPIVGYVLGDNNEGGIGKGTERLWESGIPVFQADNILAVERAQNLQTHPHLRPTNGSP